LVVTDVTVDNLIENVALERDDAALLQFGDTGDLLQSEQQAIVKDQAQRVTVTAINDYVSSVELGAKPDPNNPAADVVANVQGSETRRERLGAGRSHSKTTRFTVLIWVIWSASEDRYLLCDSATS
jgi:hypothetical protein